MIVAGNYLLEDNADEMVRKLKKSGYNSAEKVVFDLSQYHSVVAARFDDRSSADRMAKRLKDEGFDNYVLGSGN
jgi:cell division septation protein DedD